jgi:hypothetical protein
MNKHSAIGAPVSTVPPPQLKIFDGTGFVSGALQVNIIVAAKSRKSAVEALRGHGIRATESRLATHWRVVSEPLSHMHAERYALALAEPERPFAAASYNGRDYRPVARETRCAPHSVNAAACELAELEDCRGLQADAGVAQRSHFENQNYAGSSL